MLKQLLTVNVRENQTTWKLVMILDFTLGGIGVGIFLVSTMPKEGMTGLMPPEPSFGMTMTKILRPVLL